MKILKGLLFAVLALIAIILISAAFVKKDFGVGRQVVINKPKAQVFEYLKSLKSQNDWSTWGRKDPNMKSEFIGTDGTVGCISKWSGNDEVGEGEQEIKKIIEGERIENELRFIKPFKNKSLAYFVTESVNDSTTTVKWGFTGKMPYPFNLMTVVLNMDESIGKDYEEGLANLKAKLEG